MERTKGVPGAQHHTSAICNKKYCGGKHFPLNHLSQEVLRSITFPVDLMKPSSEEGKSLPTNVSYSIMLELDKPYVQFCIMS